MSGAAFKAALARGDRQIGLWVSLCSNYTADVLADIGYDWLLVDMEHSPNDMASVLSQLQALKAGTSTAIVRPAWNDPVMIKRVLDLGPDGILLPMVQSPEEAAAAVAACRYPPQGVRGVAGGIRGSRFGRDKGYFQKVVENTAILVQVETHEAMGQVEAIATVDGVDGVFFGPADIAASLGQLGQLSDDGLWDSILEAAAKVHNLGKPTGTLIGEPTRVEQCFQGGMRFVACGTDLGILASGAENLLNTIKEG
ncbi:HpcH/HpaI aldolase family protein [Halovulum sp. GXIMD14793]